MPIAPGFDTTIKRVTASPVAVSDLNTEITAMNTDDYYMSDLKFTDANNAFLFFSKNLDPNVTWGQKINQVTQTQSAIDADKSTEEGNGFYPTGVFSTPVGDLLIFYQQLTIAH